MRRIGIYAGTFDPIHDGHIKIIETSFKYLELDEVYLLVEEAPWGDKQPTANIEHRVEMAKLAAEHNRFKHLKTHQKRFTIEETLPELEKLFKDCELYFIFGADVFMKMNKQTWPNLESLLKHYIAVYERGGFTADDIQKHEMEIGFAAAVFGSPHPEHSSTNVRLNPHKKEIWVPNYIADYIDENNLY